MTICSSQDFSDQIKTRLNKIKSSAPLIHHITNYVGMDLSANGLLALGASPVMAHSIEEVSEMVAMASALCINIGTLSPEWVKSMKLAIKQAASLNIPIILDPVGCGATTYRNRSFESLLTVANPTVIKGNGSEILSLVNTSFKTKGVDSSVSSITVIDAGVILAKKNNCIVVITGELDFIISTNKIICVQNGHPLMPKVTAMGCLAGSIISSFCSIESDYFLASLMAMALMGNVGEISVIPQTGPGSFRQAFIDNLYQASHLKLTPKYKEVLINEPI